MKIRSGTRRSARFRDRCTWLLLPLVCFFVSGCFLWHAPQADDATPVEADADAGASRALDATMSDIDASAGLEGGVTTGMATINESATCANGAERWAAACPGAMIVYASPDGRADGAGTATDPLMSPRLAVERCGETPCHVRLVAGTYPVGPDSLYGRCLYVEGGGALSGDGGWAPYSGTPSTLLGDGANDSMISSPNALVVSGVSIRDVHTAISVSGAHLLVVDHVAIDAAYSGVSVSWRSDGARICDTTIVAGSSAVDISWSSSDVVLDRVDATGGYSGVDVSWSSHDVSIRDSTIRGGYSAVNVSQGAYAVQLKGSVIITTGDYHEP